MEEETRYKSIVVMEENIMTVIAFVIYFFVLYPTHTFFSYYTASTMSCFLVANSIPIITFVEVLIIYLSTNKDIPLWFLLKSFMNGFLVLMLMLLLSGLFLTFASVLYAIFILSLEYNSNLIFITFFVTSLAFAFLFSQSFFWSFSCWMILVAQNCDYLINRLSYISSSMGIGSGVSVLVNGCAVLCLNYFYPDISSELYYYLYVYLCLNQILSIIACAFIGLFTSHKKFYATNSLLKTLVLPTLYLFTYYFITIFLPVFVIPLDDATLYIWFWGSVFLFFVYTVPVLVYFYILRKRIVFSTKAANVSRENLIELLRMGDIST